MTVHAGEDIKQEEHSCIASGRTNLYIHYGNQYGGSPENGESIYLNIQLYHSWAYTQGHSILSLGHLLNHVHCSFIHNSQKLETIEMSTEEWINKM